MNMRLEEIPQLLCMTIIHSCLLVDSFHNLLFRDMLIIIMHLKSLLQTYLYHFVNAFETIKCKCYKELKLEH